MPRSPTPATRRHISRNTEVVLSIEGQNAQTPREPAKKPGSLRASVISLIAGAVSLVFFPMFLSGLGLVTGLFAVGVYFGERKSGVVHNVAPLVMGAIGLGLSFFSVAVYLTNS